MPTKMEQEKILSKLLSGVSDSINKNARTATQIANEITTSTTNSGKNSVVNKTSALLRGEGSALQFSIESSDVQQLMLANGIADKFKNNWLTKFSRFGVIDPYNTLTTTKEYIFVTKPDLCIFSPGTSSINPVIQNANVFVDAITNGRYVDVAKQLQISAGGSSGNPLMAMLSNSVTSSLDLPGISAEMIETAANIMGTKISYRSTSMKSDEDHDFNLEFEDTKNLDIYMLFKMWDEYEKLKWNGALKFSDYSGGQRWVNYIVDKVLHDQVSIYKFVVGEDGYRIVYWARITGCVPTSVPRDAFSDMNNSEPQKITVGWKGHFVRDMDPVILAQFNQIVGASFNDNADLPLYNTYTHSMDGTWASKPYIYAQWVTDSKHGRHIEYYLRWKR